MIQRGDRVYVRPEFSGGVGAFGKVVSVTQDDFGEVFQVALESQWPGGTFWFRDREIVKTYPTRAAGGS